MEEWTLYLIAGIIVLTISLLRYNIKRRRREAEAFARRRAAAQAAREAQEKKQLEMGKPVKVKVGSLRQDVRVPQADPVGTTFNGSETPRSIARWEAEIHEIGRRIMGTIDSKMVALQTLTIEANRSANRLEILLEQMESIVKKQLTANKIVDDKAAAIAEPLGEVEIPPPAVEDIQTENSKIKKEWLNEKNTEDGEKISEEKLPNVLSSVREEVESYANILNELESEIRERENSIPPEEPRSATILKPEKLEDYQRMSTAEVSVVKPLSATVGPLGDTFSLSPPGLPGGQQGGMPKTSFRSRPAAEDGLSFDALYDDGLADREGEKIFAVAGPAASAVRTQDVTASLSTVKDRIKGSNLDLRKQVEMMSDHGYTPRQIAQTLNITVTEVDLMLSLRY